MEEWFYKRSESEYGPLGTEQLKALQRRGSLTGDTLVRRQQEDSWQPLSTVNLAENTPPNDETTEAKSDTGDRESEQEGIPGPPIVLWITALIAIFTMAFIAVVQVLRGLTRIYVMLQPDNLPEWLVDMDATSAFIIPWLTALLFGVLIGWQAAAFVSIREIHEINAGKHGPLSGFWWITPVANLFMPLMCLYELKRFSRVRKNGRIVSSKPGLLLWGIELAIMLAVIIRVVLQLMRNVAGESSPSAHGIEDAGQQGLLAIGALNSVVFAALAVGLALFIYNNLNDQIRLYRDWNK